MFAVLDFNVQYQIFGLLHILCAIVAVYVVAGTLVFRAIRRAKHRLAEEFARTVCFVVL